MRQLSVAPERSSNVCLDRSQSHRSGDVATASVCVDAPVISSQSDMIWRGHIVRKWPQVALDGYASVPVVAADAGSRRYIARVLQSAGYKVISFVDPQAALTALAQHQFDVIVLSGHEEGAEWCSAVHELRPELPVLFVLQDGSPVEVAQVLDAGADCLEAPFLESDLVARARLLFRLVWRRYGLIHASGAGFHLDLVRPRVNVRGREIALTELEYRTLWVLAQSRGGVARFSDIERSVWGDAAGARRLALRRIIHTLRQKLTGRFDDQPLLQTERGIGYRLLSS